MPKQSLFGGFKMKLTIERIWNTLKTVLFYYSDNIHSWSSPVLLILQKGLTIASNANQKQAKALDISLDWIYHINNDAAISTTHFLTNL